MSENNNSLTWILALGLVGTIGYLVYDKYFKTSSTITHKECVGGDCIDVEGEGYDICPNDCIDTPGTTHTKCVNGQCIIVAGTGVNECKVNADCGTVPPGNKHKECFNSECVEVLGAGEDLCTSNTECGYVPPTNKYIQEVTHVIIPSGGLGEDEIRVYATIKNISAQPKEFKIKLYSANGVLMDEYPDMWWSNLDPGETTELSIFSDYCWWNCWHLEDLNGKFYIELWEQTAGKIETSNTYNV